MIWLYKGIQTNYAHSGIWTQGLSLMPKSFVDKTGQYRQGSVTLNHHHKETTDFAHKIELKLNIDLFW